MKNDIWISRAEAIAPFIGRGLAVSKIAELSGLSRTTVKTYIERFDFDNGQPAPGLKGETHASKRIADIRKCAEEGMTRKEAASRLGLTLQTVSKHATSNGICFVHGSVSNANHDEGRAEAMAAMYAGGKTLAEIGELYGVTRERVRQIISKRHGMTAADGGKSVRSSIKRTVRAAARDAKYLAEHGCTYSQYRSLVKIGQDMRENGESFYRTPTVAFGSQRQNAKDRGIGWKLTIWEWWAIWQKSGKWPLRGKSKGQYVMCRFGDSGAYEIGNVYIATCSHNCSVQPNHPNRRQFKLQMEDRP